MVYELIEIIKKRLKQELEILLNKETVAGERYNSLGRIFRNKKILERLLDLQSELYPEKCADIFNKIKEQINEE